jgi:hypothetical protein
MIPSFKSFLKYQLNEAVWDRTGLLKGRNLLYHYTRSIDTLKQIMLSDTLLSSQSHTSADIISDDTQRERTVVCFTRNSFYNIGLIKYCLILDKDLLQKDGIKTYPFTYFDKGEHYQFEEFHLGDFKKVSKYLIGIGVSNHLGLSETLYNNISRKHFVDNIYNYYTKDNYVNTLIDRFNQTDLDFLKFELEEIIKWGKPVINFYDGKIIDLSNLNNLINTTKTSIKNCINNFKKSDDKYIYEHVVTDTSGLLKGRALLYHNTKSEYMIDILKTNTLHGSTESEKLGIGPGISFTRAFSFHMSGTHLFKLIIDWSILKSSYKLKDYDWFYDEYKVWKDGEFVEATIPKGHNTGFESEIVGPPVLDPLSDFLTGILINFNTIQSYIYNKAHYEPKHKEVPFMHLETFLNTLIELYKYSNEYRIPIFYLEANRIQSDLKEIKTGVNNHLYNWITKLVENINIYTTINSDEDLVDNFKEIIEILKNPLLELERLNDILKEIEIHYSNDSNDSIPPNTLLF